MNMLLVLVENYFGCKALATFVALRPDSQVYRVNVLLERKPTFANAANKLFATILANNFAF